MLLPNRKKHTHSLRLDLVVFVAVAAFLFFSLRNTLFPGQRQAKIEATVEREPASLLEEKRPELSTQLVRLPCLSPLPTTPQSTQARLVKVEAGLCQGDKALQPVRLRAKNLDSGEDILVFFPKGKRMVTTNYFALQAGENRIQLEWEFGRGVKRVEEIRFFRD